MTSLKQIQTSENNKRKIKNEEEEETKTSFRKIIENLNSFSVTLISEFQMPFQPLILISLVEHKLIEIFVCTGVINVMGYIAKEGERGGKLQELSNYPQTINFIKSWRMFLSCTNIPNIQHSAEHLGGA